MTKLVDNEFVGICVAFLHVYAIAEMAAFPELLTEDRQPEFDAMLAEFRGRKATFDRIFDKVYVMIQRLDEFDKASQSGPSS